MRYRAIFGLAGNVGLGTKPLLIIALLGIALLQNSIVARPAGRIIVLQKANGEIELCVYFFGTLGNPLAKICHAFVDIFWQRQSGQSFKLAFGLQVGPQSGQYFGSEEART